VFQDLEPTMAQACTPPSFGASSEPLSLGGSSGSSHGASSSGDSSSSAPSSSSTSPVTSDLEHQQGEIFQRINELLQDPCAEDNLSSPDYHGRKYINPGERSASTFFFKAARMYLALLLPRQFSHTPRRDVACQ